MIKIRNLIINLLSCGFCRVFILIVVVPNVTLIKTWNVMCGLLNLVSNSRCMSYYTLDLDKLIREAWIKSTWMNKVPPNIALKINSNLNICNWRELLPTAFSLELSCTCKHLITECHSCNWFTHLYISHEHVLNGLSEKWYSLEWRANNEVKEIHATISNRFQIKSNSSNIFAPWCNLRYLLVVMKGLLLWSG